MIDEFYADAKERLMDNNEAGFELIANSVFYFQDIKKVVQTLRVQFQTYVKTAQFMDTIDGIRPMLRRAADMMNAMSSMMTSINPATIATRSKLEFDALREHLLMGKGNTSAGLNTATAGVTRSQGAANEDFFSAINGN